MLQLHNTALPRLSQLDLLRIAMVIQKRQAGMFDLLRESGVLSEGAGILVLESLERALARGARPYVEVSGYSRQRDSNSAKPASGLVESMKLAIANAEMTIADVDCIFAYGTGDQLLDAAEVDTIKQVFGERAYSIPITSIKGVTGNPLAAAGPFQVAASALSVRSPLIPPTANYEIRDPRCDLDFVPARPRRSKLNCVLVNVRGLGGSATSRPQASSVVMNSAALSSLIALILQLLLGLAVVQANPRRKSNQCFLILSLVIGSWLGCLYLAFSTTKPPEIEFYIRQASVAGALVLAVSNLLRLSIQKQHGPWRDILRDSWPWLVVGYLLWWCSAKRSFFCKARVFRNRSERLCPFQRRFMDLEWLYMPGTS